MPTIKSDLTNKSLPSNRLREIEVPDESGYQTYEGNSEVDFEAMDALMASRNLPPLDPALKSEFNARQLAKRQAMLNENENLAELERKIAEAKKAKATGQERLSPSARQRISMLCGISRGVKEVDIDGTIFVLKTLKGKEQRDAVKQASAFDYTVESAFEIRKQLLARSIAEIGGTDIDLFLNDSSLEAKLEFVEELDEPVLEKLYNDYLALVRETSSKYGIRNAADAKEVAEDLKK